MSIALMRRTEVWRADSEAEAQEIIQEALESGGELTKKTIERKTKKSKGEIIAENLRVTVQVDFEGQWPEYIESEWSE